MDALNTILEDVVPNLDSHLIRNTQVVAEGAGNKAMATFIKQRKNETSEDTVEWFRSMSIGKEVEAVKKQLEDSTKAMTAPLASDSFPDDGKSRSSLGPCLPKPIDTEDEQGHQREGLGMNEGSQ